MQPDASGPAPDNKLHFLDYWRILRMRKGAIFVVFILVVLTTTFVTFWLPKNYMSTVRMEVHKDAGDVATLGQSVNAGIYDPYFMLTQFELIQSGDVLYEVIDKLGLQERWSARYGEPISRQKTLEYLRRRIDPTQVRNTSIIELSVLSEDKAEAADIANTIAAVYRESRDRNRLQLADKGISKLRQKLEEQNNVLSNALAAVDSIRKDLKLNLIIENRNGLTMGLDAETLRLLEQQNIEYGARYTEKRTRLESLKRLKEQSPDKLNNAILTVNPDENLARLLERLTSTKQELAAKGKELGPKHPEVQRMEGVLSEISTQIDARVTGIMDGLEADLAALKASNDERQKGLEKAKEDNRIAAEKGQKYTEALSTYERQEKIRDTIDFKIRQEEIDKDIPRSTAVRITDVAEQALKAARPRVTLNIALGVFFGIVLGVGMAFFIEYLDTSVKTIDDVERTLQAPVLAVIPQNVGVLMEEGLDSPHAEAYRVLRTNMLFTNKTADARTITVVSGGAGEGKSTTVLNLATIFAQNGHKVLLVDSDLRRPSIHKRLKVANSPGLTNYLLGQAPLEEVVQTTPQDGLHFLPSGKLPSSAMGILNSQQMRDFIRAAREIYDYVFFDSPPLMGVSDATVLASEVDMALLVIQYRKYPQSLAIRSRQMVDKVGGRLLGVVLNNINVSSDASYYYYSGYYYHDNRPEDTDEPPPGKARRGAGPAVNPAPEIKSKY